MFFDKYNKIPDPNVISSGLDIVYYQGKHINQTINKLDELLEDELKKECWSTYYRMECFFIIQKLY